MDNILIRRQDRLLGEERATELLETSEYGFLSLGVGDDGYAYGVPLNYVYDRKANVLYFHCAPEGHKLENLKRNKNVSFCVVGKTSTFSEKFTTLYESVMVFGTVDINLSNAEKRTALSELVRKYSPGCVETGGVYIEKSLDRTLALKITIEKITAKAKA